MIFIYPRFMNHKPKFHLMQKCTACHWQCTDKRKCKSVLPKGDINPELLEDVEFKLPDLYVGI